MRVLVVDDNPDHRFLTKRALAPLASVEVLMASGGEEALARANDEQGGRPDFVLLDIKMPGMDGFEVLRRLREAGPTRDLPIVLFSSSENELDRARAKRLGANGFITKPLDARAFIDVVRGTVEAWTRKLAG